MNKQNKNIAVLSFSFMWVMSLTFTPHALAEQITITGNGAESVNEVVVTKKNESVTQQTNNADIVNNISNNASTGDNTASFNTNGNTSIQTGDATVVTEVTNTANTSIVEQKNCCDSQQGTVTVSGNGANSHNNANVSSNYTANVRVYQNANIVNDITTYANTGNNRANYNNGDSLIRTGDIKAKTHITSGPINLSYVSVPLYSNKPLSVTIIGNGFGSWNTVNVHDEDDTNIDIENVATVINDLKEHYSTGDNKADYNNGDVAILTGDIASYTSIDNGPINVSVVKVDCACDKDTDKEVPVAPVGGTIPPPSQASPSSGSSVPAITTAAEILAATTLPITGNNWLALALFGNIMMLLLGAYLRLRSGRSPGYNVAL
ncbi:MAG: hypothetical protein H0W89_05225 [Candidatus Levybacteria bacterium]|nr:hypothetical protein [Candidatus Levybacteria bacterium]